MSKIRNVFMDEYCKCIDSNRTNNKEEKYKTAYLLVWEKWLSEGRYEELISIYFEEFDSTSSGDSFLLRISDALRSNDREDELISLWRKIILVRQKRFVAKGKISYSRLKKKWDELEPQWKGPVTHCSGDIQDYFWIVHSGEAERSSLIWSIEQYLSIMKTRKNDKECKWAYSILACIRKSEIREFPKF